MLIASCERIIKVQIWHSNTDKIGKLKYMVKLESDIWSNSNMWSKLLPIYGQSQIYGQILYDRTQIHGQTKIMVIFPIILYGQTCSKYNSQNSRRSPYIMVTDMTYLLVNWTDVTSTESQPESAFANKIRDRAHKRSFTRYVHVVSFTDPPPLGRSLGTWPSRSTTSFVDRRAGARDQVQLDIVRLAELAVSHGPLSIFHNKYWEIERA